MAAASVPTGDLPEEQLLEDRQAESSQPTQEIAKEPPSPATSLDDMVECLIKCCSCKITGFVLSECVVILRASGKQKGIYRCKKCHALRSRCDRLVANNGSTVSNWSSVPEDEKTAFYNECKSLVKEDLHLKMQELIVHTHRRTSILSFTGTGNFIDEEDVRTKYANKPSQLEAVLQNSRTMLHPTRRVTLYEDLDFASKMHDEEENTETKKRTAEFAHKPVTKKIKTPTDDADETMNTDPPLKPAQQKNIEKKLAAMQAVRYALRDVIESVEKIMRSCPSSQTTCCQGAGRSAIR